MYLNKGGGYGGKKEGPGKEAEGHMGDKIGRGKDQKEERVKKTRGQYLDIERGSCKGELLKQIFDPTLSMDFKVTLLLFYFLKLFLFVG